MKYAMAYLIVLIICSELIYLVTGNDTSLNSALYACALALVIAIGDST